MQNDNPNVIVFPPLFLLVTVIAGIAVGQFVPGRIFHQTASLISGSLILLIALGFGRWAERTMNSAGTNVSPRKESTCLVIGGPFKYTRNPLYICLSLIYVSLALLVNSLAMLALVLPFIAVLHFGVILREESYLERKFGEEYLAYKSCTPRWLW